MTKQQLREYRAICREIKQIEGIMQEMRDKMLHVHAPLFSDLPGESSKEHDKIGAAIARYIEASQAYADKLDMLMGKRAEIEGAIESLPPREREVLRYRYILGMKWEDICKRMNYAPAQIHRIHAHALLRLRE